MGLIFSFGENPIVLSADVEEIFPQIEMEEKDRQSFDFYGDEKDG